MAEKKSFLLRIAPELWKELEAWAEEEFRSVNGQIEFILHQALKKRRAGGRRQTVPEEEMSKFQGGNR